MDRSLIAHMLTNHAQERLDDSFIGQFSGSFFRTKIGLIGAASPGMQVGDTMCMILGGALPMILRRAPDNPTYSTWNVIGQCNVPGIMNGEIIYGQERFRSYHGVYKYGSGFGLYDPSTDSFMSDKIKMLQEAGIEVEGDVNKWGSVKVLPETFRKAGIPVTDFILA